MDEIRKDARFAHIGKDPRFRPASRSERKLKIDRRFASMFNDPKFKLKYTVDKRGRPLLRERTTRDDMKKFYHLDQEKEEEESSSSSSDEEEEESQNNKAEKPAHEKELDEFLESDDDDDDDKQNEEQEESSSSEEDEEVPEVEADGSWNEFDDNCARSEEVSRRLAICNMDWDRVRAVDIFLLLNSWKPADGVIRSVTIYPSEYGLQQIEAEKKFGPMPCTTVPTTTSTDANGTDSGHQSEAEEEPDEPELKSDDDDDEQVFNQDDDQDTTDPVIREQLRKYQLNRLKYYYAVVECDTVATAVRLYEECDGLEYETSAVRMDLRFIPDSVTFDPSIPPHDQCTQLPDKTLYKPMFFRNTALTQTKVRCTWDETPIERRLIMKKKYTLDELDKLELDAYLASESEEEPQPDEDDGEESGAESDKEMENGKKNDDNVFKVPTVISATSSKRKSDQPIARAPSILSTQDDIDRYRALLLDFNDAPAKGEKPKKKLTSFFDEQHSGDELPDEDIDNDDDDASDIDMEITWQPGLKSKAEHKLQAATDQKQQKTKDKKKTKKHAKADLLEAEVNEDPTENERDALELLTVDDEIDRKRDYNLREMIKSHKQSTKAADKKGKKTKKVQQTSAVVAADDGDFRLNVDDQRFQALYTQPQFNIDPTNPQFKATAGTQRLIEEKLRKRKFDHDTSSSSRTEQDEDDVVVKLKRKSAKK